MSNLAGLIGFDFKDPRAREEWVLDHFSSHEGIRDAVQRAGYGNLIAWELYPVNWHDWDSYALRHQSAHNEFNEALGLPGTDLMSVDFNDQKSSDEWNLDHYREHLAAATMLGI